MEESEPPLAPTKTLLGRGLCERCPRCGKGKLFQSYLKQAASCPVCGEDFTHLRADDGPAWLTILLTCHIVVPVAIYLAMHDVMPQKAALALLLSLTVAVALLILPRAKGAFIAVLWLLAKKKKPPRESRERSRFVQNFPVRVRNA